MKYLLTVTLWLSSFIGVYAQNDSGASKSIRQVLAKDGIVYMDSVGKQIIAVMRQKLQPDTLRFFNLVEKREDKLVFSKKEKAHIQHELDKMGHYKWSDGLLENSKAMATDTINKGWPYLNKRGIVIVYDFSVPIFLRGDTLCVSYIGYSCGWLCGISRFDIYKLRDGKWMKLANLFTIQS